MAEAPSLASPVRGLAATSAGLNIIGGLFGFLGGLEAALIAESRGRLIRAEAEADILRFRSRVRRFKATQALAFLKGGVTLAGSPLSVLDETIRVSEENITAIRARAAGLQLQQKGRAVGARARGGAALTQGLARGARNLFLADAIAPSGAETGFEAEF